MNEKINELVKHIRLGQLIFRNGSEAEENVYNEGRTKSFQDVLRYCFDYGLIEKDLLDTDFYKEMEDDEFKQRKDTIEWAKATGRMNKDL